MASLDLESPPDLDGRPMPAQLQTDVRMQEMLRAIEDRLGVALNRAVAEELETFADVAAAVQNSIWERQRQA